MCLQGFSSGQRYKKWLSKVRERLSLSKIKLVTVFIGNTAKELVLFLK